MVDFNDNYKEQKCYWGLKPSKYIPLLLNYLKNGNVLDIGAGEGRNALFLAKNGFNVTAIDVSEKGIEKLKIFSKENSLLINTVVSNIMDFEFNDAFDLIISVATFHFLKMEDIYILIDRIKNNTNPGGINFW